MYPTRNKVVSKFKNANFFIKPPRSYILFLVSCTLEEKQMSEEDLNSRPWNDINSARQLTKSLYIKDFFLIADVISSMLEIHVH